MSYTVTILRVADHTTRDYPMEEDWTDSFWWKDGNGACDCNRGAFFGEPDDDDELPCGSSLYRVRCTLPDGTVVYDEIGKQGAAVK